MDSQSKDLIEASIERKYLSIKKFSFQNAIDWNKTIKYLKISSFPLFLLLIIFFRAILKLFLRLRTELLIITQHLRHPHLLFLKFKMKN